MSAPRRLFFALWPNDALRQQVCERVQPLRSGHTARFIPAVNFHVTLVFLGSLPPEALATVIDAAGEVESQAFDLTFDHVETWMSAHIACLAINPTPLALTRLVDQLRARLRARNIEPDQKDFKAHVTIARDWQESMPDEPIEPLIWPASEFVLVESRAAHDGSEYTILNRWPLMPQTGD